MQFREVFVTNAGQAMLARAAAKKERITWGTAKTVRQSAINIQTEETIRVWEDFPSGAYTLNGCAGQVTSSIANGNKITLHCELTNGTSGSSVYGLGIYAKREDGEEKLAIVARTGDATASYIGGQGTIVKLFIDVTVNLTDYVATAVTVDASNYAQAGALAATNEAVEALEGRAVTTHSAGDEETGDNQTVRGEKRFPETAQFLSIQPDEQIIIVLYDDGTSRQERVDVLTSAFGINMTEAENLDDEITAALDEGEFFKVPDRLYEGKNIGEIIETIENIYACDDSDFCKIGDEGKPFKKVYARETHTGTITNDGEEIAINDSVTINGGLDVNTGSFVRIRSGISFGTNGNGLISEENIYRTGETSTNKEYKIAVCSSGYNEKSRISVVSDSTNEGLVEIKVFDSNNYAGNPIMKGFRLTKSGCEFEVPIRTIGISGASISKIPGNPSTTWPIGFTAIVFIPANTLTSRPDVGNPITFQANRVSIAKLTSTGATSSTTYIPAGTYTIQSAIDSWTVDNIALVTRTG